MPAVNGVGEPCAGEPHARFEAAGAGNGADLTRSTGVAQPAGKPAEHEGPRLYRQLATAPAPDPTCGRIGRADMTPSDAGGLTLVGHALMAGADVGLSRWAMRSWLAPGAVAGDHQPPQTPGRQGGDRLAQDLDVVRSGPSYR